MKEVKVNGYSYWYQENTGKIFLDREGKSEIDKKYWTANEKEQLETWVKYNGKPMWSY